MKNFKLLAALLVFSAGTVFAQEDKAKNLLDLAAQLPHSGNYHLIESLNKINACISNEAIKETEIQLDDYLNWVHFSINKIDKEAKVFLQKNISEKCTDESIRAWKLAKEFADDKKRAADKNESDCIAREWFRPETCEQFLNFNDFADEYKCSLVAALDTVNTIKSGLSELIDKKN